MPSSSTSKRTTDRSCGSCSAQAARLAAAGMLRRQRWRLGSQCRASRRGSGAPRLARPGRRRRWASWRPWRRCS
eukprot:12643365-Alexandrium_andersonii.AAC.1